MKIKGSAAAPLCYVMFVIIIVMDASGHQLFVITY